MVETLSNGLKFLELTPGNLIDLAVIIFLVMLIPSVRAFGGMGLGVNFIVMAVIICLASDIQTYDRSTDSTAAQANFDKEKNYIESVDTGSLAYYELESLISEANVLNIQQLNNLGLMKSYEKNGYTEEAEEGLATQ